MTQKKPILVDQDGVFADFVGAYYKLAKEKHPELYKVLPDVDKQKYFYVDEEVEQSHPHLAQIAKDVVNYPEIFEMIEPYEGMIEGLKNLKIAAKQSGREVFICTAPHKENKNSYSHKAIWIEKHLGFDWLDNLLIVRDKTVVNGVILIDDKPKPVGRHNPIWHHVLFDQSYNRHLSQNRIYDLSAKTIKNLIRVADMIEDPNFDYKSFELNYGIPLN